MKAVTAAQMRAIEEASVQAGVSLQLLMENAGRAVADAVADRLDNVEGSRIVILIGPGNNGGDGLVAATRLARMRGSVKAFVLAGSGNPAGKRPHAQDADVEIVTAQDPAGIRELEKTASAANVVVDAVLGTGSSRPITAPLSDALAVVRRARTPVVAVDLPTGMNPDTGRLDPCGLPASLTLMLGRPKIGPIARAGEGKCGKIQVLDIGIPPGLDSHISAELLDSTAAASLMPTRKGDAHKGDFGRTLIVAGSRRYPGAALLAAKAATRSGAGLIELATPESVYPVVAGHAPEAICTPIEEEVSGLAGQATAARQVISSASDASAMLIGPGLGTMEPTAALTRTLTAQADSLPPLVVDADALNVLARTHRWWRRLPETTILTPHPGEMARLAGISVREVQDDRLNLAAQAAEDWGVHLTLKGAATIIASPGGRIGISPFVNPGLAKGGTGDVLAGLMAGILAQMPQRSHEAASLAVYLHGRAGEIARRSMGETAMKAGDVIDALPQAFLELGERQQHSG